MNIFIISFSNNQLIMGCACVTAGHCKAFQALESYWTNHPHFLCHLVFHMALAFCHHSCWGLASQSYDAVSER